MADTRSTFSESFINLSSIVFILIGVYIAVPSFTSLYYVQTSRNWPQVSGHVISSTVERRWASRGDDLGQDYLPRVWFGYNVAGREYIAGTLSIAQPWVKTLNMAKAFVSRYPAGSPVTVYYLPSDPAQAVLDRTIVPPMECVRFGIGVLFILTGTVSLLSFLAKVFLS